MSHSILMLSIQIYTKSLVQVVQQHQIVLLCKPYKSQFNRCYTVIRYSRLTLCTYST